MMNIQNNKHTVHHKKEAHAMTPLPARKKCLICHQYYNFNPDVGMISCPNCMKKGSGPNICDVLKALKSTKDKG